MKHHLARILAGERLTTRATVISLGPIRPGAAQMTRLDTTDETGALVCRTYQLGISRGVAVDGGRASIEQAPEVPSPVDLKPSLSLTIDVPGGAAHTYTECARIWNPIHTDRTVALAAGLPDIILHGTATMALSVSALVNACLDGDPTRVRRLGGRFAAMVLMPSTLTVNVQQVKDGIVRYQVLTEDGQPAYQNAFLCYE